MAITSHRRPRIGLLRPAFDRLVEIAKLEEDWDTYGGLPPTPSAVASAGQLVIAVADRLGADIGDAVVPYSVMPFPDGGVQVTWHRPPDELQVDVGPSGDFGYLRVDRKGDARRASEADNVPFSDIIVALAQFLR